MNRTLGDWLGLDAGQIVTRRFQSMLSIGAKIAFETHILPLLRMQGFVNEIALDLLDREGKRVPFIVNASERRGPDGEHLSTHFALFRAIDRRNYEKALLSARKVAEAETLVEQETALLREQFIAVLGHDLRNPLAAVGSGIRLLRRGDKLDARRTMVLGEMLRSVTRAQTLIDDVLDFARGRMGDGMPITRDAARPLAPVLLQVIEEVQAIDPERRFVIDIAVDRPVDCDPDRVGQLLANLLSNAMTHGDRAREVIVKATTSDDAFALSVTNFGQPIDAEARERLFQPFFRGAVRHSRNGLGLGLFIVQEVARAHGGTVSVTSDEDATRFVFTMAIGA